MSIKGGRFREWWDVPAKVGLRKLRQVCPEQYDTVSKQTQPTNQPKSKKQTPQQPSHYNVRESTTCLPDG